MFKKLPRNVIVLGLVSFFNDFASEMIYPLVPIFLTTVLHASVPVIGIIEGAAEATASITKYLFGAYSDFLQKRKIFVVLGYSLSAISKPLIGLANTWPLVLFARFMDRSGKGLRTAPRDSLLLESADGTNRGYIFGFHRAFDSLGAVVGPLAAILCLVYFKENIRQVFLIAFIPAAIAIFLLIIFIKEKKASVTSQKHAFVKISFKNLNNRLKIFLLISFIFSLGNSSDAFLLLRAKNVGLGTVAVILAYVLYNISQTVFATPLGVLSDKLGPKKVFAGGLLVFAAVYLAFGLIGTSFWIWFLFPVYGVYIAATDGVSKAYVSQFIQKKESGTYFGAYYFLTAVGTFLASVVGGMLWIKINPSSTFYYGSVMSFAAFIILLLFNPSKKQTAQ